MLARAAVLVLSAMFAGSAPAAAQSGVLPDFDARIGDRADVPRATERARDRLDARLGDMGRVSTSARTGGVKWLAATDAAVTGARPGDAADVALDYVRDHEAVLGLDEDDLAALRLAARYTSVNGNTYITWHQTSRGLESYDTTLSVNLGSGNEILNVTGSPVADLRVNTTKPAIGAMRALAIAKDEVGGEMRPPRADREPGVDRETTFSNGDRGKLVVVAGPDGDRLAWELTVAGPNPVLYLVVIDAITGELIARHSLTHFANQGMVFDNYPNSKTSPYGAHPVDLTGPDGAWLNDSAGSTRLRGAYVHAYSDENGNNSVSAGENIAADGNGDWSFPMVPVVCNAVGRKVSIFTDICSWDGATAAPGPNKSQATTQLFYFNNVFHDWLEAAPIGFDAASHNFEGADRVIAESHDSISSLGSINNASMSTPADGFAPRMQMFLYTSTSPAGKRPSVNSTDDAGIVYHEYTHGLSNRLVNNGLGNALGAKQSRAMGEGWSDWFAADFVVEKGFEVDTPADGDLVHAEYTSNDQVGSGRINAVDCAVGSANATRCPGTATAGPGGFTYGDLGNILTYNSNADFPFFEEHAEGELWAQTLWDLRKVIGGSATRRLAAEAMRLSPAAPSMLDERDAILLADAAAGGTFHDQIWSVFAVRGMGVGAATSGAGATRIIESFAVPTAVARTGRPVVTDPAPLGDADGAAEPGETVRVRVPLRNLTPSALAVPAARLSATAPAVVGVPTVDYGSIAGEKTTTPAESFAVTVPSAATCGAALPLSLKVNGATTLPFTIPIGAKEATAGDTYAATGLPTAITDFNLTGAASTLSVPTVQTIDTLRVHVKLAHTVIGDLDARLTAPDGTKVKLFDRPGSRFTGSDGDNMDVVLDDEAVASIQDRPIADGTVTVGSFRPTEFLSTLSGKPLNGNWTLRVLDLNDAVNGTGGSLEEFSITALDATCNVAGVPPLPAATSAAATAITSTGATVNGEVDPNGTATEYAFQYGTTADYGQQTAPVAAGAGNDPAAVSAGLTGLTPGTTHHYRAVALRNGTVVAAGADMTFATLTEGGATPTPTPTPTVSATATATASPGGGGGGGTPTATATASATATATATATPPPTAQPSVAQLSPKLKLDKRRTGTVSFSAQPPGSLGAISIKASKAGRLKAFKVGAAPFTVPATGVVTVTIKASKKAYKALGKRPGRKAKAVATFTLGGATFALPITVRR